MAETLPIGTATQAPSMNLLSASYPSMISAQRPSYPEKVVKSKPRFTEFMCSHNEVLSDPVPFSGSPNILLGVQICVEGDLGGHSERLLGLPEELQNRYEA